TEAAAGELGTIYFEGGGIDRRDGEAEPGRDPIRGWGTAGDIGWVDAEGYLYLADRADNLIIVGGVNVYPRATEDALLAHPDVLDAAVFGVPSELLGQEVVALVRPRAGEAGPELAS